MDAILKTVRRAVEADMRDRVQIVDGGIEAMTLDPGTLQLTHDDTAVIYDGKAKVAPDRSPGTASEGGRLAAAAKIVVSIPFDKAGEYVGRTVIVTSSPEAGITGRRYLVTGIDNTANRSRTRLFCEHRA